MGFSKRILIAAIATAALVVSAGPASAHINGNTMNVVVPESRSYAGAWPVTVTGSPGNAGEGDAVQL